MGRKHLLKNKYTREVNSIRILHVSIDWIDVILVMDSLSKNHAIIDSQKREVYLTLKEEKENK